MESVETNQEGRRNIFYAVSHILDNIIPDEEVVLKKMLNKFRSDLFNQAPEVLYSSFLWKRLINIFNSQIDSFDHPWQKQLHNYLANVKQT